MKKNDGDSIRSLLEIIIDYPVTLDNTEAIILQLLAAKALLKLNAWSQDDVATTTKTKTTTVKDIGRIGGRARAKALSSERRKEIAKKAAQTRWST